MIRLFTLLVVAVGTAALFCTMRTQGVGPPAWEWLGLLSTVGVLAYWLATPKPGTGSAAKSAWPEAVALGLGIAVGLGRASLPAIFNSDLEAAALVYVAALIIFFVACRNARTAHRDGQPVAAAHFMTAVLAASTALLTSAAILFLE